MCKRQASGSIFSDCRDVLFKKNGDRWMTNKEMRHIIDKNGGCMLNGVVDKSILHMQESESALRMSRMKGKSLAL
jgi:hypothetical protein